jgi:hypothetical protein
MGGDHDGQAQNAMVFFKMLAARFVAVLCSVLRLNQSPVKRRLVEEAVAQSAQVEPESLERVLKDADEKLLERLVPVLAVLEGERPLKHLLRLVRHPSPPVRIEALRHVFRKGAHIREVFPLIDDRDETLRRTIVKHLACPGTRRRRDSSLNTSSTTASAGTNRAIWWRASLRSASAGRRDPWLF